LSERDRLARLRALFGTALPAGVEVGIGDDAAVLAPCAAPLVFTIDAAVEGVHFRRAWMSLREIGFRSLMAAASDLAAMGATPRGIASALILPDHVDDADLDDLARGQAEAAEALGTAVVGGNLSRGTELSITTAVLGETSDPIRRRGARAGDVLAVAGPIGLAGAGVEALLRGATDPRLGAAIEAYKRPLARIADGVRARGLARAAIDLSDGLAIDASRLGDESGVGIAFEERAVLGAGTSALGLAAAALGVHPLELALHGGEDYALLAAFPPESIAPSFVRVGTCTGEPGMWLEGADGHRRAMEPRGFDHFT
jgi:thiamine-monophosphate kinase